jgi:hypothetical protein
MLLAATGATDEALAMANQVIARAEERPEPVLLVDGLLRRTDIHRLRRDHGLAREDLRQAIRHATAAKLERHALYAYKDLASLLLEQSTPDPVAASEAFSQALNLALSMRPPQALMLVQLAEDVLARPAVVGRQTLSETKATQLSHLVEQMRQASQPSIYQRGTRATRFQRLVRDLAESLARIVAVEWVSLTTCSINLATGQMRAGAQDRGRLRPAELATLRMLLLRGADGITTADLAARRGLSLEAATKSIMRLRAGIGASLTSVRVGKHRKYTVMVNNE